MEHVLEALWSARIEEAGLSERLAPLSFRGQVATIVCLGRHGACHAHVPGTPRALRQLCAAATDYEDFVHWRAGGKAPMYGLDADDAEYDFPSAARIARCAARVLRALTSAPPDDTAELVRFYREYPGAPIEVYDPDSADVYPAPGTLSPIHYRWAHASLFVRGLHNKAQHDLKGG